MNIFKAFLTENFDENFDKNFDESLDENIDVNFVRLLNEKFSRPLLHVFTLFKAPFERFQGLLLKKNENLTRFFHGLFYTFFAAFERFSNFRILTLTIEYKCLGSNWKQPNSLLRRVCKLPFREQLLR